MKALNPDSGNLRDALVTILCVAAIAATGYSLYLDGATRLEAGDAAPAGEIDFRSGAAHRRYADRALWERVDTGDIVYNRNSIRTGDGDSGATIRLNDDTRIELDQATMIILQISENEVHLQLKAGSLEIRRSRPRYDRPLTVGRGDHVLELDSGEVRLESTQGPGMHVTPLLGSVKVRESSRRIRTGDQITLTGDGRSLRQLGIVLLLPAQGDRIAAENTAEPGELTPVRLAWKTRDAAALTSPRSENENESGSAAPKAAAPGGYINTALPIVEVSHDPNFESLLQRIQAARTEGQIKTNPRQDLELRLAAGLYYWRVRQGTERSATGKFRVMPPPELVKIIAPTPDGEIHGDSDNHTKHNIQFAWSSPTAASHHRLEIFQDSSDARLERIVSQKVERDYVQVRLAPGEYRFRVLSFAPGDTGRKQSSPLTRFRLVSVAATNSEANTTATFPKTEPTSRFEGRDTAVPAESPRAARRRTGIDAPATRSSESPKAREGSDAPGRGARVSLLYPTDGRTIDMANETGIVFRWRPPPNRTGQAHRLRFFDLSRGGRRVLFETTTRATSARFVGLQELEHDGQYEWDVTPLPAKGSPASNSSVESDSAKFRIILSQQPEQTEFLTRTDDPPTPSEAGR